MNKARNAHGRSRFFQSLRTGTMGNNFDDLQQSYGRFLREKNFIERFYETKDFSRQY